MSGAEATAGVLFMLLFGLVFVFFGSLVFGAALGLLHAKVTVALPCIANPARQKYRWRGPLGLVKACAQSGACDRWLDGFPSRPVASRRKVLCVCRAVWVLVSWAQC